MITNDSELQVVQEQLRLVEEALDSIRRELKPRNEAKYTLIAEAYIDQIGELRLQIDAYRGFQSPVIPSGGGDKKVGGQQEKASSVEQP